MTLRERIEILQAKRAQATAEKKRLKAERNEQKRTLLGQKRFERRLALLKEGKLKPRGKIGLCLGGGGARGFAHMGALKAFEEAGIKCDLCVGTSAGSIMGGLYCAGVSADEMYSYGAALDMGSVHNGNLLIPQPTAGVQKIITDLIGDKKIEDLDVPFCAVATDLVTTKEIWLTSGNVAKAVAASCCVPQFFKPVVIDELHLVDGGLLNNIPADVCRTMGADYVLTVDVNSTRGDGTKDLGAIAVLKATFSIVMTNSSYKGYINSDVLIPIDTSPFKSYSKKGFDQMYELGYEQAKKALPEILDKLYW